ncbi:MAG: hypothetical protein AAF623_00850 [Planctomycetota bacterium]
MNDSFWSGGASAYADSVRNAYHIQMKNLRDRFKSADDSQRPEIESEMRRVECDFKTKMDDIKDSLF